MTDAKPYPKASQLARGERRYRRKVASPKQWQAIIESKRGPCRCLSWCVGFPVEYHHVVERDAPYFGDDVADNIVPLCAAHHGLVTQRHEHVLETLAASLTDAEYAYVVGKLGEGGMERLFGVSGR